MCHPSQLSVEQLLKDCRVQRTRRSGPGGQHRNKVETAVVIEHLPSGERGEASERRSQEQNRRQAIHRLRIKLALAVRHPRAAKPSPTWQRRLNSGRMTVNPQHEDFPALLAEALDALYEHVFEIPAAADQLGLTATQLLKLLKLERSALELVNQERLSAGLPKLH